MAITKMCAACKRIVQYPATYCPDCQARRDAAQLKARMADRKRYDKERLSSTERGYDDTWARARKMHLARYPLCEMCLASGKTEPADMVHHIQHLTDGGARLDPANLMSLCREHHESVHKRERWKKRDRPARE